MQTTVEGTNEWIACLSQLPCNNLGYTPQSTWTPPLRSGNRRQTASWAQGHKWIGSTHAGNWLASVSHTKEAAISGGTPASSASSSSQSSAKESVTISRFVFEDVGMSPWQKQNNDGCFNLYTNNDATAVLSGGYPEKMKKKTYQSSSHSSSSCLLALFEAQEAWGQSARNQQNWPVNTADVSLLLLLQSKCEFNWYFGSSH